ncbi:DUF3846 domain-containing protein [Streptomyces sp. NPDC021100]|uniref:DUF3846 domain-containing protein n=1 Tax=Streptomyces sp. NPDC021100 TaxID=3365114 RepID=UPI0037B226FB
MTRTPDALLITPQADIVPIGLPGGSDARLTALRSVLRCDAVDVVALTSALNMWLDDEGFYSHPVNRIATALAARFGFVHQDYHGPVLLTGGADAEGDALPLSEDKLLALLGIAEEL